jgi:hypothetical protein
VIKTRLKLILALLVLAALALPVCGQQTADKWLEEGIVLDDLGKYDEAIRNNKGLTPFNRGGDEVVADLEGMNNDTTTLISALTGLIGVIVGAIITFILNYAKTKAMMRWEMKYTIYTSILELDKGRPLNTMERDHQIRLANRLKSLSRNKEAKEIATTLAENKFDSLKDKQKFIDEKFIPAIEKDLQDTMSFLGWRFWKCGDSR